MKIYNWETNLTSKQYESVAVSSDHSIEKTQIIIELFKIPNLSRNDIWYRTFNENIHSASFTSRKDQVFTFPEHFPYFLLDIPKTNNPSDSFCLKNLKDDFLIEHGCGIIIFSEYFMEWIFSFGDIMDFHLTNKFNAKSDSPPVQYEEVLNLNKHGLLFQPIVIYLPKQTKHYLKLFLISIGVVKPKTIIYCTKNGNIEIPQLAFNIFKEDFESTVLFNEILDKICWFLPRHYVIFSIPKNCYDNNLFTNL